MCLVHKNSVNAQLFKGHHIVLAGLVVQLVQLRLDAFLGLLHLLNGESVPTVSPQIRNAVHDLVQLLLQKCLLPLDGNRNFLKLAVTDDDGIVIAGGNSGTEAFSILRLKILAGRHKNVGGGIELQEFACPLLCQMVRDNKQTLLAQPQPLGFHRRRCHLVSFPCTDHMGKQRIAAIKNVCHGVDLMWSQMDFGVHAHKIEVTAVILTGAVGVEFLVVEGGQSCSAFRVRPNPVLERLLEKLLLALGNGRFLLVEDSNLFAISVLQIIEDTDIPQIEGFFHDFVGVNAFGAVGAVGFDIATVVVFALNVPFAGNGRVMHLDVPAGVSGCTQLLKHEVGYHIFGKPCGTQTDRDFAGGQVLRLYPLQCGHIGSIVLRV